MDPFNEYKITKLKKKGMSPLQSIFPLQIIIHYYCLFAINIYWVYLKSMSSLNQRQFVKYVFKCLRMIATKRARIQNKATSLSKEDIP
jgi:hypothetical protein